MSSNLESLRSKFETMAGVLETMPHLRRLGRLFSETVLVEIDGDQIYLTFNCGRVVEVAAGPSSKTPWRFAFRTSNEAISRFWTAMPQPGYHDIFGLVKYARGKIDGDILVLVKNLRFFKEFMALGRARAGA